MPLIGAHDVGEGEERREGDGDRKGVGEGDGDGGGGVGHTAIRKIIRAPPMRIVWKVTIPTLLQFIAPQAALLFSR